MQGEVQQISLMKAWSVQADQCSGGSCALRLSNLRS